MATKTNKSKRNKAITKKRVQAMEERPFIPAIDIHPEPDDEPWGDDCLTLRQRLLIAAYIGPAAGNACRAAEMAGYKSDNRNSLKATASATLTLPNVQQALARAIAAKKCTAEWLKSGLMEIAGVSMANFISRDGNGRIKIDWDNAFASGAVGQIKEVRCDPTGEVINVKLFDRQRAIELLLKLSGQLKDEPTKIELSGPGGGPLQTETKHSFDYAAYVELFRRGRTSPDGNGERVASADRN